MTTVDAKHVIEIYCRALALHPARAADQLLNALPDGQDVVTGKWRPLGPKEWGVATFDFAEPGQRCDTCSAAGKVRRVYLRDRVQHGKQDRRGFRVGADVWRIAEADESDYDVRSEIWNALIDVVSDKRLIEWLTDERDAAAAAELPGAIKLAEDMLELARKVGNAESEEYFIARLAALRGEVSP